jgi:hypothetical protein
MTLYGSFYSAKEHMMNVKHKTVELAQRDSLYADCFEFKSNWNNGYGWFVDKRACVEFIKTYFELEKEPSSLEIWIHVFFYDFLNNVIKGFSKGFNVWYTSLYDGIGYIESFRFNIFIIIIISSCIILFSGIYYIRCYLNQFNTVLLV